DGEGFRGDAEFAGSGAVRWGVRVQVLAAPEYAVVEDGGCDFGGGEEPAAGNFDREAEGDSAGAERAAGGGDVRGDGGGKVEARATVVGAYVIEQGDEFHFPWA